MAVVGAGALCGLDYIGIIYLYWLLLLALGLLPGGVGFLGHAGKQRLQHGQQARRERLSQLVARVGRDSHDCRSICRSFAPNQRGMQGAGVKAPAVGHAQHFSHSLAAHKSLWTVTNGAGDEAQQA